MPGLVGANGVVDALEVGLVPAVRLTTWVAKRSELVAKQAEGLRGVGDRRCRRLTCCLHGRAAGQVARDDDAVRDVPARTEDARPDGRGDRAQEVALATVTHSLGSA